MKRILSVLGKWNLGKGAYVVLALCATTALAIRAQTFTSLHSFDGTDGEWPYVSPVQAANGDLYGTTYWGGSGASCASVSSLGCGTVFKISPSGRLTTLYNFCSQSGCTDGYFPSVLVQATNGDLYGTTAGGGSDCSSSGGCGTVFKITPSGALTTLYSFCSQSGCTDGKFPYSGLIQATNGDFYGTTGAGGAGAFCPSAYSCGTVFRITPSGSLTTLYSFCSQSGCTDGEFPYAALVQATSGDLYGTTVFGGNDTCGAFSCGTVFKINRSGTLTTLYSFCSQSGCTDGLQPNGLVQATNGDLYGTAVGGGANGEGTVFKITPSSGTLTTVYNFCSQSGCIDGSAPVAGLVQGSNGDLYGTTQYGGAGAYCSINSCGTAFQITQSGTLMTLYNFCSQSGCVDGNNPMAGLVQATNGDLYGTTQYGGTGTNETCTVGLETSCGTVFRLSVGLGPFVETLPTSGKIGVSVRILGTNLTGATSVSFDGTPAVFEVVSGSEITTTVPAGASTGKVQVATPGRTLSSNVPFRVP